MECVCLSISSGGRCLEPAAHYSFYKAPISFTCAFVYTNAYNPHPFLSYKTMLTPALGFSTRTSNRGSNWRQLLLFALEYEHKFSRRQCKRCSGQRVIHLPGWTSCLEAFFFFLSLLFFFSFIFPLIKEKQSIGEGGQSGRMFKSGRRHCASTA